MKRLVVLATLMFVAQADARRDRTVTGDVIKAARFLSESAAL